MKAWVLHGINDMRFDEVPKPELKGDEKLVEVKAAGICSSDIPRVFTTGAYHYPIILGHEFSGITEDGRRVGVFPLLPCFECENCKVGSYETCTNYSYIGSRRDGSFAEYVSVPEWNLIDLPDDVSFEEAAMLEPAAVALHAVKMLDREGVSHVAIIGNGTIGRIMARWIEIKTGGSVNADVLGRGDSPAIERYDACIEAVGSTDAFSRAVRHVKPNGQIVLVGNPNVEFNMDQKLYWQILRKQLTVRGSWNSSYPGEWQEVANNIRGLKLSDLISHKYGFEDLDKALDMMNKKTEKHIKVMLVCDIK